MCQQKRHKLVEIIKGIFKRKQKIKKPSFKEPVQKSPEKIKTVSVAIYESELQAIGVEGTSWDTETGGDLFGIWNEQPIVYLATNTGPNSVREAAHFKLDVGYLIKLSGDLNDKWGLRYFGDWHSHHRLGLDTPSSGDKNRLARIASKNNFDKMAELIVTFTHDYHTTKNIHIHSYLYADFPHVVCTEISLTIIKGISPIREALIASSSLMEQNLGLFSSFPIQRIIASLETNIFVDNPTGRLEKHVGDRILSNALLELGNYSSKKIEFYQKPFGCILVIPIDENTNVAFAVDKKWPYKVLQIDWIDRSCNKAEEILLPIDTASLINIKGMKDIYLKIKELKRT
jgi:hypothetical protein